MGEELKDIKISVRNLVEFILQSGNLDNRGSRSEADAMQAGSRLHRKLQKQMGSNYSAEVPLSITVPITREDISLNLTVEGRADGIINNTVKENDFTPILFEEEEENIPEIIIDEIKGMYMDLSLLKEPIKVHRAQAMCYAYIYADRYDHKHIGIRMTYCNLETENLRYFEETLSFEVLKEWFDDLIGEYAKWAVWQIKWIKNRNKSIQAFEFPYPYRKGQKKLVAGVYRTILRDKNLFIEAPTGERVIIVMGAINALKSRISGTFIKIIHALLRAIRL